MKDEEKIFEADSVQTVRLILNLKSFNPKIFLEMLFLIKT